NLWTISFAGEATEPFEGYRLWRFTEVEVLPDATARSTPAEETRNNVTLRFRTTNAVTSAGFVALQAPFGYVFPTLCQATLQELDATDTPIAGSGVVSCSGTPLPGPTAALHPVGSSTLAALAKYQLNVVVQNPTVIALEAGTWQIQSYATKEADYSNLLDIGEAPGFHLTEVFHTLRIIYPVATPSTIDELELRMQILLSTSLEIGDVLEIVAPDGYDVTGNSTSEFDNLQRACNKFRQWSAAALPKPTCN
ncbi:Ank3, partial [Symbiodinium microadriaticum]